MKENDDVVDTNDMVIPFPIAPQQRSSIFDEPVTGTLTFDADGSIAAAKALLKAAGYVTLKEKSYRQAQERQRAAEAVARYAEESEQRTRRWAEVELHNEIRDLQARCTWLYGKLTACGVPAEELRGGWTVVGVNLPIERTQTVQCHCGVHPYIITDYDARPTTRFVCPEHGLVPLR